jgi:hypothetical protein
MKRAILTNSIFAGLCLSVTGSHAQTYIGECPKDHQPATVNLEAAVSTAEGCPLLTDKKLRKLVDKNFSGTLFAGFPNTCLSGTISEGTVTFDKTGVSVDITGTTESAQRLMPEAAALGSSLPLFLDGAQAVTPFISGAAATIVSIRSDDTSLDGLQLVLSDRFTVNLATGLDTEDFEVVGAKGATVTGRLIGNVYTDGKGTFYPPFTVTGSICIKSAALAAKEED